MHDNHSESKTNGTWLELTSTSKPTEGEIHDRFFRSFLRLPGVHLIKDWQGWSLRTKMMNDKTGKPINHSKPTSFYSEFDIANFERDSENKLLIKGYEVKGYTNKDNPSRPPDFADGVGQALALLLQGADYSFVILPKLKGEDTEGLKLLCDQYAKSIGIIYVEHDLSRYEIARKPDPNPSITTKRKIQLAEGATHPNCTESTEIPLWLIRMEFDV